MQVTNDLGKSSFDHVEVVKWECEVWEESEEIEMASIECSFKKFGCEEGERNKATVWCNTRYSEGFLIGKSLNEFEC